MAKKKSTSKKSTRKRAASNGQAATDGKHLVIVESPTKARTINRYLGPDYVVMASVGHVRDLPSRAPKGQKQEVPGVDLEHGFEPAYEVLPDKQKTVKDLQKAAGKAQDVWFATDLDREGEAIAWHLAEALGIKLNQAKRVVFNAITQSEINRAFEQPRSIDQDKVNAQQARRILDRIVGYQVSPLLWKKVAGGLSAGRVQSVAVRLAVERERQIEGFVPDETWSVMANLALSERDAQKLGPAWRDFLAERDEKDQPPSRKAQNRWLAESNAIRAELVEFEGEKFEPRIAVDGIVGQLPESLPELSPDAVKQRLERAEQAFSKPEAHDLTPELTRVAQACGLKDVRTDVQENPQGRGPARWQRTIEGTVDPSAADYRVQSVQTKRTTSRPPAPLITSTLQQAASNRLGFASSRAMRLAQQLYEGIDLGGARGQQGLITYMRTDSTYVSPEALNTARGHIEQAYGKDYLPDKPNYYTSSNKSAQEAHEAIRPTDAALTPKDVRHALNDEQFKLYDLIWRYFVASQMTPAQWDSTTALIEASGAQLRGSALFKATGRTLVFDGFYKVMGVPTGGDDLVLPRIEQQQALYPFDLEVQQQFTGGPARYNEASLIKRLEAEGIGRPSTYAAIISTIQDREYVAPVSARDKRLMATDLGKVVTDMLVEAFPRVMDVRYTRGMEQELDEIEEQQHDWRAMLEQFYGPFRENLDEAHKTLQHAKAAATPAPYTCPKCGAPTEYRFGRNGQFLSCTRFNAPPQEVQPEGYDGTYLLYKGRGKARPKIVHKDTGERLGWTKLSKPDKERLQKLSDAMEECDYAAPIDKEGRPLEAEYTDIACPECGSRMTKRSGRFGPFLGCENYPQCKGIVKLDPKKGTVVLPKAPPLTTDLPCPKCESPLYMRDSKRGYWLSCSTFPKCRGRLGWSSVEEAKQAELEKAWAEHTEQNPTPVVYTNDGKPVEEGYVPEVVQQGHDDEQDESGVRGGEAA